MSFVISLLNNKTKLLKRLNFIFPDKWWFSFLPHWAVEKVYIVRKHVNYLALGTYIRAPKLYFPFPLYAGTGHTNKRGKLFCHLTVYLHLFQASSDAHSVRLQNHKQFLPVWIMYYYLPCISAAWTILGTIWVPESYTCSPEKDPARRQGLVISFSPKTMIFCMRGSNMLLELLRHRLLELT